MYTCTYVMYIYYCTCKLTTFANANLLLLIFVQLYDISYL